MRDIGAPIVWRIVARVLLSFARPAQFWLWSPIIVGVAVFISSPWPLKLILGDAPADAALLHEQLVISICFLCAACVQFSTFVTGHMARLLALPHNHVTPGIRGPVMGVAVVLTLLGIVLPVLFWPRPLSMSGEPLFPLYAGAVVAVVAAEFASIQVWPSLSHLGLLPALVGTTPWLALTHDAARRTFVEMYHGQHPVLAAALYACAAIILITLWALMFDQRRLAAMGPLLSWPKRKRGTVGADGGNAAPRSHAHVRAGTPWRRFRLRTYLIAAGARDGMIGLIGGAVIALGALSLQYLFGPAEAGTSLILSLMISILVPFVMTTRAFEARKALLTFELLLPQSRRQFARGFGLAMLANAYLAWAAAQFGLLVIYALLDPAEIQRFAGTFSILLPIAAAYQFFFFGILAWQLSLRPTMLNVAGFFTLALVVIPLMARIFDRPGFAKPTTATFVGLGLLVGGVVLVSTALRRWTRCEIT
jgi:hypothetical protein